MREFLRITLLTINVISFVATLIFGVFGVLAEILNPPTFEKFLSKLHIPLGYDRFLLIAYISVAIMIITYFLRKKFFGV